MTRGAIMKYAVKFVRRGYKKGFFVHVDTNIERWGGIKKQAWYELSQMMGEPQRTLKSKYVIIKPVSWLKLYDI
jgi:hypothetical protein